LEAKEKHKLKLIEYLGNPEKEFPKRGQFPAILEVSKKTLYKNFTPLELSDIEKEAVEIRKASSSRQRATVLDSLFKRAIGFSHPDIHVLSNRVKTFTNGVLVSEQTEALLVDVTKVYPPDKAAAQEFLDRTEGKVIDKKEITGANGKDLAPILNVTLAGD